jgi:hypothetical protein
MTVTVSLNQVGVIRATQILHGARNEAARRHETTPQTVTVDLDPPPAPVAGRMSDETPAQHRVVDLRV